VHRAGLFSMLTRVNMLLLFLLLPVCLWAVSGSYSADGVTLNWTTAGTSPYSVSGTWVQVAAANKGGGIHKDPWPGSWVQQFGNGNTSGSWTITGLTADQPMFLIMYTDIPPVTETHRSSFTISNTAAAYYADFAVPGNLGGQAVTVTVWQNGSVVTSTSVGPGAGASSLHVTGLDPTGIVTVVYGYGVYTTLPGGSIIFTANQDFEAAGGTEPTAASEPPEPTQLLPMRMTAQTRKEPVAVTPTTLPTAQTTPTNTPAATAATTIIRHTRSVIGVPFGSPSGSSGVTKQDSEVVANAVVAAVETMDTNRDASDSKTLDALNQIGAVIGTNGTQGLTALNALRTESVVGRNKQIDVAGQNQRTLEAILVEERKANSYLDAAAISLGNIELGVAPPTTEQTTPPMTVLVSNANDFMASVAEATEVQPNTGSVATDDTDEGASLPTVALPGGAVTPHTISLNPLNSPKVLVLAHLLRSLVGWLVLFMLIGWTYIQIPIWMTDALKGGSGFTAWRAATGAVPLIGIAVMTALVVLGGAVILTAPTILWAYADPLLMGSEGSALGDIRDVIIAAVGGTDAGKIISLLDAVCPTGLVMTAAFNYITLRVGGQSICAGLIAFSKVLAS